MYVRFLSKDGTVFDARQMTTPPRMGESVSLDGRPFMVGAVLHRLEGDRDPEVDVVLIEQEEALRFLGKTS